MSYDVSLYIDTGAGNDTEVFWRNMTSNVAPMWRRAGCDVAVFHGRTARDCIDDLASAIKAMESEPAKYEAMNPENGWGSYETCLDFLKDVRNACELHPACVVHVSR